MTHPPEAARMAGATAWEAPDFSLVLSDAAPQLRRGGSLLLAFAYIVVGLI